MRGTYLLLTVIMYTVAEPIPTKKTQQPAESLVTARGVGRVAAPVAYAFIHFKGETTTLDKAQEKLANLMEDAAVTSKTKEAPEFIQKKIKTLKTRLQKKLINQAKDIKNLKNLLDPQKI